MPNFHAPQLFEMANRILIGAGVPEKNAAVIAAELRDANLVGHDSHGVMRLMQYIKAIDDGHANPEGAFEVVTEKPGFAIIDGNFNFGQVTAAQSLAIGIDGARKQGTFTVMIRNCNHVGRLGSYTERAALDGMASLMTVNAPGPGGVAPFGGIDRRLGTNPISLAVPREDSPFVLDMTTSITAEGKIRVAAQKGEALPEGWIIDADGNPSTNPADFYGPPEGAILPLGGVMGFKGFGLSVMIDVFAGILSGSGICRTDLPRGANGVWMYFVDVAQFLPREQYDSLLTTYVASIKNSRKQSGVEEIFLPGEIEQKRREERVKNGVEVPVETYRQISDLATRFGVSLD